MYRNTKSYKSLVYWLLLAWVTVAVAINPEPFIKLDIELKNEGSCAVAKPLEPISEHVGSGGGG